MGTVAVPAKRGHTGWLKRTFWVLVPQRHKKEEPA